MGIKCLPTKKSSTAWAARQRLQRASVAASSVSRTGKSGAFLRAFASTTPTSSRYQFRRSCHQHPSRSNRSGFFSTKKLPPGSRPRSTPEEPPSLEQIMKHPRNIIVKTCMTVDEFVDFSGDCQEQGKSHSAMLRDSYRSSRNSTSRPVVPGRPAIGQRMAMFPSRSARRPELRMRN